ncbi:MAG: manganese efflux pump MntP family protein [Spirochaetaceae bacterium]|jgi:putative Mn2+ efflux pump MntP|nr:manganese efflux pump MntP family protein [Spirochaetaceae bacterium]
MLSLVLIGLSLSMDAFAVSVGAGISLRDLKLFHMIRASLSFALFQFFMPVAGWRLGETVSSYIEAYDHWAAFALLSLIGGRMVKEGFPSRAKPPAPGGGAEKNAAANRGNAGDIRNMGTLLVLSLATSIDALAVGVSFSLLNREIWTPAALIGGVTFLVCLTGFGFARRVRDGLGFAPEKWAQLAGGLILIGLGIKILAEHLF